MLQGRVQEHSSCKNENSISEEFNRLRNKFNW